MSENCIFCDIAQGKTPVTFLYEDELAVAFDDLNPQAPQHKLIIPRQHIATLNEVKADEKILIGHLYYVAKELAHTLGIDQSGYRVVLNCHADGGQSVFHVHVHLLGGRQMSWPPG